ncbi:Nuclease sbcCD subunit D [Dermatophilus congolensis]|uniref:Nuclease SbcCD subunit D n=1 Tax=Dermatophilus congolensis TaxID=1863 RepID=A0AA46GZM4_9MICO|nr:exonuclease SbcCD subunit D [Dermatophilus congolensis]STD04729.1 Nuclease sbcCD subunit D [Dermatophilus congolensis]
MRIVHTSDWQLGMTRHYLAGEAQARYTAARIDAIRAIGELAHSHNADAIVVAGDVFDSNLVAPATVHRSIDAMRSVGLPIYLLAGNHDALNAVSIYTSPAWLDHVPENVHVLDTGITNTGLGFEIVAAPLPSNDPRADLLGRELDTLEGPGDLPRIALGHGSVDLIDPDSHNPATMRLATMERALECGAVNYIALGDRHSRLSVGNTGRIHYSGACEVTDFVEKLPGDVLIVDIDSTRHVEVTPIHVGTWTFLTIEADLNSREDIVDLDSRLAAIDPKDRTVVRTILRGTLSLTDKAELDTLLDRYSTSLAALFSWKRHEDIAVAVEGTDVETMGLSGFVASAARELEQRASTPHDQDAAAARDALSLLFRLSAGVRR